MRAHRACTPRQPLPGFLFCITGGIHGDDPHPRHHDRIRIIRRLGATTQEQAEQRLHIEMQRIDVACRPKARPCFADCAARYLAKCLERRSLEAIRVHVWDEQDRLFPRLPAHLQPMALFAVNTGLRNDNVCGLEWSWEVAVPEIARSVFIVPAAAFKTRRDHVVILNDIAWSIVQAQRGLHPIWVFP